MLLQSIIPALAVFGSTLVQAIPALQPRQSAPPKSPPDFAIQQALNISTGNPSKCATGTKYFLQPIDHATYDGTVGDGSTFYQQFEVIDKYFRPGGPILFFQSTENANMLCLEQLAGPAWAAGLGALVVVLEHRYFGISCPYGLNYTEMATWPVPLLKPLTLDNVLLDSITFVKWVQRHYAGAADSKVIYVSGSYGGTLAAIARIRYPETFFGSIASSLLTTGLVSDPNASNIFGWGDWANQVYNDFSYEASQRIRSAMSALRSQISSGNFSNLQQAFNLCKAPSSQKDGDIVAYKLMEQYTENLQNDLSAFGNPFQRLINATLSLPQNASYLEVLNVTNEIHNTFQQAICVDWDPHYETINPYQYLQCTYFPQMNGYTANSSIWGLNSPSLFLNSSNGDQSLLDPWCKAAFNISSVQGGPAYQASLGLDTNTLQKTSRLLLTGGLLDPVTSAGTPPWYPGQPTMEDSRVYLVQGAGHTADIIVEDPADSDGLKEARGAYLETMKAWLAGTDM